MVLPLSFYSEVHVLSGSLSLGLLLHHFTHIPVLMTFQATHEDLRF